jgi:formylglycine-generating enzyme required for sulfatase activity
VLEWCQDWYAATLPGGAVTDPQGPASGTHRTRGGGAWDFLDPSNCRSAARGLRRPEATTNRHGFRVVLAQPLP